MENKENNGQMDAMRIYLPQGIIGFPTINHYWIHPLFSHLITHHVPIFWKLNAISVSEEGEQSLKNPKLTGPSFILMSLNELSDETVSSNKYYGHPHIKDLILKREDVLEGISPLMIKIEECLLYLIVTLEFNQETNTQTMSVNVRAPFIIHLPTGQGWQIILPNRDYPFSLVLANEKTEA